MTDIANVTVLTKAWTDLRFITLGRVLGITTGDALSRCMKLWGWQAANYSPERPTYVVDADTIESAFGVVPNATGVAEALVRARLAEETPDGFRIRGTRDDRGRSRIEWMYLNGINASKGGAATKRKRAHGTAPGGVPVGEPSGGYGEVDNKQEPVGTPPGEPTGAPTGKPLDQDLYSDSDLDLDLSGELQRSPRSDDPGQSQALSDFKAKVDTNAKASKAERAERVPDRAWKAADALRNLILQEDPRAAIGLKPWGDAVRDGIRLEWADAIRLIVERDRRSWDDLKDTMRWLFHQQPAGPKFVVQSPEALRKKWDRIQAQRRNVSQQQPLRGAAAFERQQERVRRLEAQEALEGKS